MHIVQIVHSRNLLYQCSSKLYIIPIDQGFWWSANEQLAPLWAWSSPCQLWPTIARAQDAMELARDIAMACHLPSHGRWLDTVDTSVHYTLDTVDSVDISIH